MTEPQPPPGKRQGEIWWVLACTLAISVALVALRRLEVAVMLALTSVAGPLDPDSGMQLEREAAQVGQASQTALQRLPRIYRQAAFRLGYELGFASEWLGGLAQSTVEAREQAAALAEEHLAAARGLADQLSVGLVTVLPIVTAADFVALPRRIESDENGLADRIERRLSLHHRHLYLLGMHLGTEDARLEMTRGSVSSPEETLIRYHATVTGIPTNLWERLASAPGSETSAQTIVRYRAGLAALVASLGVD